MSYCPHGSLWDIVRWYTIDNADRAKRIPPLAPRNIPEPFIWSVFEAMTEACLLMENGTSQKMARPPAAWWQIVHRDIGINNTWLDAADPDDFPSYPRAVLGDFGTCILTKDVDIMNPNHYADNNGTAGYMAPEQTNTVNNTTGETQLVGRLQGWTNIYNVGKTIQALMRIEYNDERGPDWQEGYEAPRPIFDDDDRYFSFSTELTDLVEKCIRYDPSKRTTAKRLKGKILRRSGLGDVDRAEGHRTDEIIEGASMWLRGWKQDDKYALGMAFTPPATAAGG